MSISPDEESFAVAKDLLDRFAHAWNAADSESLGSLFDSGATFVDVGAGLSESRAAISRLHAAGFAGALRGTRIAFSRIEARKFRAGAILVHAFWEISPPSGRRSERAEYRTGLLSLVACSLPAGWSIVAGHNTSAEASAPSQPLS